MSPQDSDRGEEERRRPDRVASLRGVERARRRLARRRRRGRTRCPSEGSGETPLCAAPRQPPQSCSSSTDATLDDAVPAGEVGRHAHVGVPRLLEQVRRGCGGSVLCVSSTSEPPCSSVRPASATSLSVCPRSTSATSGSHSSTEASSVPSSRPRRTAGSRRRGPALTGEAGEQVVPQELQGSRFGRRFSRARARALVGDVDPRDPERRGARRRSPARSRPCRPHVQYARRLDARPAGPGSTRPLSRSRSRNERPRVDGEHERPEPPLPEHVLQRLAGRAAHDERAHALDLAGVERSVELQVELAPGQPEDVPESSSASTPGSSNPTASSRAVGGATLAEGGPKLRCPTQSDTCSRTCSRAVTPRPRGRGGAPRPGATR